MLKKLGAYAKPYSKWIALGVVCSAAEAVFELLIPLVMADIVNIGIETADQNYILRKGALMAGMAIVSLCFGLGSAALSSIRSRMPLTVEGFTRRCSTTSRWGTLPPWSQR